LATTQQYLEKTSTISMQIKQLYLP